MASRLTGAWVCLLALLAALPAQGERMLYFAYGSNMSQADLDRWCDQHDRPRIRPRRISVAVLRDHALSFDYFSVSRRSGAANVVESAGGRVYGLLMDISEEERDTIRMKEGWPDHYEEIIVTVQTLAGRSVEGVTTYRVKPSLELPEQVPPSREYIDLIISSARKYRFPKSYIEELEKVPTE